MTSISLDAARARNLDETLASPRAAALVFAALVALAAAPAWLWPVPRGNDIVDHWARLTLYRIAPGDPIAGLYHVHLGLIPNLGVDLLYLALAPLLSPQATIRLALALAIALPAFGAFAIHRALYRNVSPTIWLVPIFSYNVATTVGLINFALGAGLALIGVAYALSRGERLRARDVVALNAFGAALFFCHLIALAMFAALLGLVLAAPLPAPPRVFVRRVGVTLLALAAPLALTALRQSAPSTFALADSAKVSLLYAPIATMTEPDRYWLYGLVGLAALAILRGLQVAPRAWLALPGFALLALAAPSTLGAATLIDARLKVYVWYFAVAAVSLRSSETLRPYVALAACALTAGRLASVAPDWSAYQTKAAAVREGLAALPMGSRALVVSDADCRERDYGIVINLTTFAVIDRRSYVNTLFAQSGMQPVAPSDAALDGGPTLAMDSRWLTPEGRAALPVWQREAAWAAPYRDWRRHFTHLIEAHGACASQLEAPGLTRLGGGGGLDVFKID